MAQMFGVMNAAKMVNENASHDSPRRNGGCSYQ